MKLWVQPPILLKKIKREFQLKDISCLWTELKVFFILTRNGTFIGSFEKEKVCMVYLTDQLPPTVVFAQL